MRLESPSISQSAGLGPGCVKTFSSRFERLSRNKNRVPAQISGLLTNQAPAYFK